jgi:hypothetical protein
MKVIGMHGRCEVDAGDGTPIVQREDGMIQKFYFDKSESSLWYAEDTSYDWGVGYLNRFKNHVTCNTPNETIRVFFVSQELLDAVGFTLNDFQFKLEWSELTSEPKLSFGCVVSSPDSIDMGNTIGQECLKKIKQDRANLSLDAISKLADYGLCASTDKKMRWELYSFFHINSDEGHLQSGFQYFVSREFPHNSFGHFMNAVESIR